MKIERIKYSIIEPIKAEDSLTLNELTLLTGKNDSGKSFHLANFWAMGFIAKALSADSSAPTPQIVQYVYDNSISSPITGNITSFFEKGVEIHAEFINGRVVSAKVVNKEELDVNDVVMVNYLSSALRTFTAIKSFLTIRKSFPSLTEIERAEELLKTYKLYDLIAMEQLIKKCPITITPEAKEHLSSFEDTSLSKMKMLEVDLDKCDYLVTYDDDTKKYASTLSAGEQSLLNISMSYL